MTQRRPSSLAAGTNYGPLTATVLVALYAAACTRPADAQLFKRPVAIHNARILAMDGAVVEKGTLVIKGERIVALGSDVKPPLLAQRIDARGGTLTPGLIDVYRVPGRSSSGAGTAVRRAEDAFDRYDTVHLLETCRNGVTAVYLSPGSSAGICGMGAIVRLARDRAGGERLGRVLKSQAALGICLGSTSTPIARLKTLATVRKQFRDALEYRKSLEDYQEDVAEYKKKLKEWLAKQKKDKEKEKGKEKGKDEDKDKQEQEKPTNHKDKDPTPEQRAAAGDKPEEEEPKDKKEQPQKEESKKEADGKPKKPQRPGRKPKLEIALKAVDRELPVRILAHRSEDILNALELAEEFSFDLILEGAAEAHLVAEELADAKVLVVVGNLARSSVRGDDIYRRASIGATAVLSAAGVRWIVGSGTEDSAGTRFVASVSQLASARSGRGVDPLVTVTAHAADALRVADQIGRLRPGLLADLVLWSDDPLEPAVEVRQVFVGGVPVYQAKDQPKKGGTE